MKLNFLPLSGIAALFIIIFSPAAHGAQNQDTATAADTLDFAAAYVNELPADTVGVMQTVSGQLVEVLCWFPKKETIDTMIKFIKLVDKFEDKKGDNSKVAQIERQRFLKTIEDCRRNRYQFLFSVTGPGFYTEFNGQRFLLGDALTYRHLKELSRLRNPLAIQDYLIMHCWQMHEHHLDGNFATIIPPRKQERIAKAY